MSATPQAGGLASGSAGASVALFLRLVRERGLLRVGTGDYVRVETLLSSRECWGKEELASALAALLATSAETWRLTHALAVECLGMGGARTTLRPVDIATDPLRGWRKPLLTTLIAVVALTLVTLVLRHLDQPDPIPDSWPVVSMMLPAETEAERGWRLNTIESTRTLSDSFRWSDRPWSREDGLAFAVGLFLLMLGLRWWWLPSASEKHRQQWLAVDIQQRIELRKAERSRSFAEREEQIREMVESGQSLLVPFQVPERPAVSLAAIDDAAVTLGRIQEQIPGLGELVEEATVKATVEAGGRVVPVFESGRLQATLLVLVDDEKKGHPYLKGFQRVLERWEQRGVHMLRYSFEEQPDPLWPYPRGAPLSFDELSRRHPDLPLVVFSRRLTHRGLVAGGAPWTKRLDVWPIKAWIDPDPTPLAEHSRRPGFRRDVHGLNRLGFVRFGLDEADLPMLARYLAEGGVSIVPPKRRPLPKITSEIEAALRTWAVAAARVPRADWDLIEHLRRTLYREIGRLLPERRHVALLIRWLNQRQGTPARRHQAILEIEEAEVKRLRREQVEQDRILPESDRLLTRVAKMLLENLQATKPGKELRFLRLRWELKQAELALVGDPEQALKRLDEFRGTAVDAYAEQETRLVLAEGSLREDQKETLVRQWFPAEAKHKARAGAGLGELFRGHRWLWRVALLLLVALASVSVITFPLLVKSPADLMAGVREALLVRQQVVRGDVMPKTSELVRIGILAETPLRPAMIQVSPGSFQMGSPEDEEGRFNDETQHFVTITKSFYLAETEVTQAQYSAVKGSNPSSNTACGGNCPVENVSWVDALLYTNQLSIEENLETCYLISGNEGVAWTKGISCEGYRLPTEAEWEYVARAGSADRYAGADRDKGVCAFGNIFDYAFGCEDGYKGLAPVERFLPNSLDFYDMTGNVYEWVWDWHKDYESAAVDPRGPSTGRFRVVRGGSFGSSPRLTRVAYRDGVGPSDGDSNLGFRVARSSL